VSLLEKNLPLKMARANLENLPEFALPAGFSLRWYQPGDESHWRHIHLAAERFIEITPELFNDRFGANTNLLPERQCYVLEPRGEVIGTGTAWFGGPFPLPRGGGEGQGEGEQVETTKHPTPNIEHRTSNAPLTLIGTLWGRVHWMAMLPEVQGRGLGKALLTAICQRLRELGHERAYLHTSAARLPAIRLYLKFGFEPVIRNDGEAAAWEKILGGAGPAPSGRQVNEDSVVAGVRRTRRGANPSDGLKPP